MKLLARLMLAIFLVCTALTVAEAQGTPRRTPDAPEMVKEVPPEYTPDGRVAGIEGRVLLSADVLADGTVGEVQVIRPLDRNHYGLDSEAIKAMKQWLFKPAMKNGEPVSMVIYVDMGFSLKNKE